MKIENFISYEQPTNYIVHSDQYTKDGQIPVLTAGQSFVLGYTDEEDGIYTGEPVVIFDDFTTSVQYVDFPFKVKSSAMKILKNKQNANIKFCYYLLSWLQKMPPNHKRQWISTTSQIDVNLPPIEWQKKIVQKIESVSNIIKYRKEELKKLDELVSARFVEMFGDPILNNKKFPTLSGEDFFKLSNGKPIPEEKRYDAGVPAYGGNGIFWYTDEALREEDTLVVGRVGFQSGNVHYAAGPLWITDNAMYISQYDKDKFNLFFLCELMKHVDFSRFQDAGDLKKITQKPFMSFQYILPSMDLQQQFIGFKVQVDKSKVAVKKALDKAQLLFDSLMQKYFG